MNGERTQECTPREMDCLRLIGDGLSAKGVASELGIAPSTVEKHLSSVRRKLGVKRTVEALKISMEDARDTPSDTKAVGIEHLNRTCSDSAMRVADAILRSQTRQEAWQKVREFLTKEGYDHAIVGLVAEPMGQLTNGAHIVDSSFGDEVMELYEVAGGANADPVAQRIAGSISKSAQPFFCSSTQIIREHMRSVPSHVAKMMARFLEMDLQHLYVVPNSDMSTGAPYSITLSIDSRLEKEFRFGKSPELADLKLLAEAYWSFLKSHNHLSEMVGLTRRQREALLLAARGFRVEQAAEQMHMSRRSAEKVLQQARKKLGAPTTAAAVFRASVFGVF